MMMHDDDDEKVSDGWICVCGVECDMMQEWKKK